MERSGGANDRRCQRPRGKDVRMTAETATRRAVDRGSCVEHLRAGRLRWGQGRAAVAIAVLLLAGCTEKLSDEEQIRRVLDQGVAHLEAGDSASAADLLSERYLDSTRRDRTTMKRIAFFILRRGPVRIALKDVVIDVEGNKATARFVAWGLQGAAEINTLSDVLPTGARQMQLDVKLAREDDDWRVTAIDGDGMKASF